MKAAILTAIKTPISIQETNIPIPEEHEALVEVRAAALNHRDVWITKGMYPGINPPVILGSDGAGIYEGKEVIINPNINWGENQKVQGDSYHILGLPTHGTFAEKVLVNKDRIHPKPSHLSMEQAAALPLGGMTAYRALISRCQATKDDRILISGIGGGVALFAFQFAVAMGAEVWVTSGSEEKIQKAIQMGAKGGVNYKEEDWHKKLGKASGGFDVIIDSAGGDGFPLLLKTCNAGARIAFYGGTQGNFTLNPQFIFWKQLSIFGSTMGSDRDFVDMLDFVNEHKVVPVVDSVYDLAEANAAFDRMDKGLQFGKIILKV